MKRLIVITGPTACGKTALSVRLAQALHTEIISCDSRQFYKEMSIGTAKPTPKEMQEVPHHFVDSHSISEEINAGVYERLAIPLINDLFKNHDQLILTGGSGLFIDAITKGFDDMPDIPVEIRDQIRNQFKLEGLQPILEQLQKLDPEYVKEVDTNNPQRVIRALEVCLSSGKTYSELRQGQRSKRPFEVLKIVIDRPREELYDRINRRVHIMMEHGLVDEVKSLIPFRTHNALQTVGYREIFEYLDGDISLERAVELVQQNSRRYAKRQLTWFRRTDDYHWVSGNHWEEICKILEIPFSEA